MSDNKQLIADLYSTTESDVHALEDPEVAYLVVHHNEVLGTQLIPGLKIDVQEMEDGIRADIRLLAGTVVEKTGASVLRDVPGNRNSKDFDERPD